MTAMVIFAHSAITYGGGGDWFYVEVHQPASRSSILLTLFVATCSVCMMGCFFLLAGYFTPGSLERKGYWRFVADRLLRLGLPLLLFGVVVAPLVVGLSAHAAGRGFRQTFLWLIGETIHLRDFHTGPMWFAEDLLVFSLAYCMVQAVRRRGAAPIPQTRIASPLPPRWVWFGCAFGVGFVALMVRQVYPIDMRVFGTWPAAVALYLFLFIVGIVAWRRDWLRQLDWRWAWPSVLAACLAWPAMPVGTLIFAAKGLSLSSVRGFGAPNVLLAFWEPLVQFGVLVALLLLFRRYWNETGKMWSWLGRRAYAVYFIHPLALVMVAMLLRHVALPALAKFAVVGVLGCVASWLAGDLLIRIPGLKRIL